MVYRSKSDAADRAITESVERARRRLLKRLAAGAVITITSLPDSWKSPVVDSVLLPAHAAASDCPSLMITGRENLCSNPVGDVAWFAVDDDPKLDCPALVPVGTSGPASAGIGRAFGNGVGITVEIGGNPTGVAQTCITTPDAGSTTPVSQQFMSLNGATWTATTTLRVFDTGVSVDDIVLTPN